MKKTLTSFDPGIYEKKWWIRYRPHTRGCVKVANVKSAKTRWLNVRQGDAPKLFPIRTHRVYRFILPVRWGNIWSSVKPLGLRLTGQQSRAFRRPCSPRLKIRWWWGRRFKAVSHRTLWKRWCRAHCASHRNTNINIIIPKQVSISVSIQATYHSMRWHHFLSASENWSEHRQHFLGYT